MSKKTCEVKISFEGESDVEMHEFLDWLMKELRNTTVVRICGVCTDYY